MTGSSEDRARDLYDEGARILASLWDDAVSMVRLREAPDYHDPRGTLAYARVLVREGDAGRAVRAIRSVLALQETRPQDAHCGNFRWLLEQPCVTDLNGVEFMLDEIITLLREHAARCRKISPARCGGPSRSGLRRSTGSTCIRPTPTSP